MPLVRLIFIALLAVSPLAVSLGCSFDWDSFDPRSGSSSSSSGGGLGGAGGHGGEQASAAGGSGGSPWICGDGEFEGHEECDDGNRAAGDGCDADCQVECQGGIEHPTTHHCYLLVLTPTSWNDALVACRSLGMGWDMVAITSPVESDWLLAEPTILAALASLEI